MNVKNRKCIRHLSIKSIAASRKRNVIAIIAIALTTLMFTSLFTVLMSINASYQTYQFRQCGGYCHGTFKDVTEEQVERIAAHSKVKEIGVRKVIGTISDDVFAKSPAEVSFMDANCTKWSYAEPTVGRMPESEKEIAMDTKALELLGILPELGNEVTLSYTLCNKEQSGDIITDTFTLVGYWNYDNIMPVHYINISEYYANQMEEIGIASGMNPFLMDLNVMMANELNIRGQMEQVDLDLGYTWEERGAENCVRIGVNWGYTTAQLESMFDVETLLAVVAFLVLVVLTGYLIIYNIFQISVVGDIRFYGLLKTIGVTPRQLRRIIRLQALVLCMVGIPLGMVIGYGVGALVTPSVLKSTTLGSVSYSLSLSPIIFVGAAIFSLITVLLSCFRPGKLAAKVSPVEATRYIEVSGSKKKSRPVRGAKISQMAFANLGRNKSKTVLVVLSLSMSVVLFNLLIIFVGGFDIDKYLSKQSCADFIISSPDYFQNAHGTNEFFSEEDIAMIQANTKQTVSGCGYKSDGVTCAWMPEQTYRSIYEGFMPQESIEANLASEEHRGEYVEMAIQIEGLDESLMEKLTVFEGSLEPLKQPNSKAIAIVADVDDYGNLINPENNPAVGDTITVTYAEDIYYIDERTGELCTEDTPLEYLKEVPVNERDVDYTVCALVEIPNSMSYRYYTLGYRAVLPVDALENDSERGVIPFVYLFDTLDERAEAEAESYLAALTEDPLSPLMYESKATARADFEQFKQMFLMLGGLLCAVIAIVGILNFINAIMTEILSRSREFAMLQAVGMTVKQINKMLLLEGIFYALSAVGIAFFVLLIFSRVIGNVMENMFWFFSYHLNIVPTLLVAPIFTLMGCFVPIVIYHFMGKASVVDRLRVNE